MSNIFMYSVVEMFVIITIIIIIYQIIAILGLKHSPLPWNFAGISTKVHIYLMVIEIYINKQLHSAPL